MESSRHLWNEESKAFLEKLVSPVPGPFRDIARHSIAAKIGQVVLEAHAPTVSRDHCIEGYIKATQPRDNKSLTTFLENEDIDYTPISRLWRQ